MMSGMSAPPPLSLSNIEDGKYTHTVYLLIRDGKFADAVRLLGNPSPTHNDRASLSLQAWCHYQLQNWDDAARCYEQLLRSNPDVEHYHLYYAQCLYKAGQHQPAQKACLAIDNSQSKQKFLKIQAAIYYEINEINACRATIEQCNLDDPDTIVNLACLHYKVNCVLIYVYDETNSPPFNHGH
ncbi:hypothetical protein BKA69DRAFT_1066724 [Paraphysoderma sedebokerense]|nr:hypothetical protein BKA69DRAFT_1066724 [Paraphysoderma sedebokerense]